MTQTLLKIFARLPYRASKVVFYVTASITLIYRYIFSTTLGAFLLVLSIYSALYFFAEYQPLTPKELMSWFHGLEGQYKVAFVSSSLTLAGFVIAFHTATASWRSQLTMQLKATASSDIDRFFNSVIYDIHDARAYIEQVLKVCKSRNHRFAISEIDSQIHYITEESSRFYKCRENLNRASREVYSIYSRHSLILIHDWDLHSRFQKAAEAIGHIAEASWVYIPLVDLNDPHSVSTFYEFLDCDGYEEFLITCDQNQNAIALASGSIRGRLIGKLFTMNLPMFVNISRNFQIYRQGINSALDEDETVARDE